MERHNILIATKAYPTISLRYRETVCTAGLLLNETLEATDWIRIYPVRFRQLERDDRFKKWSIINAGIERNHKDHRRESYRIDDQSIEISSRLEHGNNWKSARDYLFPFRVPSTSYLRENGQSLGLVRPKQILGVFAKSDSREWGPKQQAIVDTKDLFEPISNLEKIPFKFGYKFIEDDDTEHKYQVIDWEIMQLFRNCRNRSDYPQLKDREKDAAEKVKLKLEEKASKTDLHFILGNIKNHPHRYTIIGLFYPPIVESEQLLLF